MDSKPVYFITLHRPVNEIYTPQNKKVEKSKGKKGEKNGNDIPCSHSVAHYNNNTGVVNYSNQIMKYYNCGRKSNK